MGKPVIASINGPRWGQASPLPWHAISESPPKMQSWGQVFVRVGLIPELGSSYTLPRLVGIAKACELIFTGKTIDATEAKEMGLVNEVVPRDDWRRNG